MELRPIQGSSRIEIGTGIPDVGDLLLWIPEAVSSNTGVAGVYPVGTWNWLANILRQTVSGEDTVGPGNCPRVDPNTFECAGIRIPAEGPVEWTACVTAQEDAVEFRMRLTNRDSATLHKAGAAVCLKFLDAAWWSDEHTFVVSGHRAKSLQELGRDAGLDNGFQAYRVRGESCDQVFYREFWGFNRDRLDRPVMVSENADAGLCVGIESEWAYFLHSNPGNPCTDIMLVFGDVPPGEMREARGRVWVRRGGARELLDARRA